jgi:hypothetical protein
VVRIDLFGIVLENSVKQKFWNDFVPVSCWTFARLGRRVPAPRGDWSSVPVGNWSFRVPVWGWSFVGKKEEEYCHILLDQSHLLHNVRRQRVPLQSVKIGRKGGRLIGS